MAEYKEYKEYKDESSPIDHQNFEDAEIQERDDDVGHDQAERLLAAEEGEASNEVAYKTEWHLRTGWAVLGSLLAVFLVFLGLMSFTKLVIIGNRTVTEGHAGIGDFRRPATDYVLDPNWNFDARPKVRKYDWKIVDIVGNPDGVFREMITINGQFPGPMIECNEGDTIIIDLENQSVNATSIHFHGLYQNGTNHMDGTSGITQCPIAPGRKFKYEFTVTGQSGTYYYHGHQAVQISDGLYGPLVVHGRDEKELQQIPYASDRVVMLQDHYHDLSSGLLVASLKPGSEASPIPDGALINGLNKRDCSVLPGRLCDNHTADAPSFDMSANFYHRFRFINVGVFAWFQVSVDEHEMAITEADGTDLVPSYMSRMMIGPAQRYSAVLHANQTTGDAFWLRARMVSHCWKDPGLPAHGAAEIKAALHYTSHNKPVSQMVLEPSSSPWAQGMEVTCKDMDSTSFIPSSFEPAPSVADHSYYLRSNLEIGDWRLERGFFNQSTFRPNLQEPTLHRTVNGFSSQNETFNAMRDTDGVNSLCYDVKNDFVIQHAGIKVVDLIIQNFDEGNHPMHLHGHKFWVLGQGHGMFPGYDTLGLKPEGRGVLEDHESVFDNLLRRDVATAEGFGWLALRFVADNPGVWAFHCHTAWHSEAGMVMQFVSRVDQVGDYTLPQENLDLCNAPVEELEKGAAPKDEIWFGFGVGG